MSEQPVIIPRGDEYLVADICHGGPEAVILLSGWGGTRFGPQRILWQAAAAFAGRGYTTARFDFRGRGDSAGDSRLAELDGMIDDTVAVAEWLRTTHGVQRFSLVGLCAGANVALGVASLRADVEHIVCWSLLPFMEHKTQAARQGRPRGALLREMLHKICRLETWRKLLRGEANVRGAMQVLVKDKEGDAEEKRRKTSARNILADLEKYRGRLHLLYGTRDPEAAGSRAFFDAWCRKHRIPVDITTIPGAPHNFYTANWTNQVIMQTVDWIANPLMGKDSLAAVPKARRDD